MAKPIRETPVLEGKDAQNFIKEIKASENTPIAQEDLKNIKESYEALKALWDKK